jgi:hypothetical protein
LPAVLFLPIFGSFEAISSTQARVTHAACDTMQLELILMLQVAHIMWCEVLFVWDAPGDWDITDSESLERRFS